MLKGDVTSDCILSIILHTHAQKPLHRHNNDYRMVGVKKSNCIDISDELPNWSNYGSTSQITPMVTMAII